MKETTKANERRLCETDFWGRVFRGRGIDIGSGDDLFNGSAWERVSEVEPFDLEDGDANMITKYRDQGVYDFVHSSNCLEHMEDPQWTVAEWFALLKIGGHLVFTVPHEDLYEQGTWPSQWNADHKWSFAVHKHSSWCPKSVNVTSLFAKLRDFEVVRITVVDSGYDYSLLGSDPPVDQTFNEDGAEAFIEVVLRKQKPFRRDRSLIFKHSGARGDMIYGLPAIMASGGGVIAVNLSDERYVGKPIERGRDFDEWRELLLTQDYVEDVVEWDGIRSDVDLDLFREMPIDEMGLSECHLRRFGIDFDLSRRWFFLDAPKNGKVVVSRSPRYHGYVEWDNLRPWLDECVFLGFQDEFDAFKDETGLRVERFEGSLLDAARLICGCSLFVGNQSFFYSLAEAMKVPRVLEVCDDCPNCMPRSINGYTRLNSSVLRHHVDDVGLPPENPPGFRAARGAMDFIGPRAVDRRARPPKTRSLISVVEVGCSGAVECPDPVDVVSADGISGNFVAFVFGDVALDIGWDEHAAAPLLSGRVGAVLPVDSDDLMVVASRALFEGVGVLSPSEMARAAMGRGMGVVKCDMLEVTK